jgi:hypothetical protein
MLYMMYSVYDVEYILYTVQRTVQYHMILLLYFF